MTVPGFKLGRKGGRWNGVLEEGGAVLCVS